MSAFTFDAKAALAAARQRQLLSNHPNRPNQRASEGSGLGRLGPLGAVHISDPEMTPYELACEIFEERAAIREFCGGQERAEAERAAWIEAQRAVGIMDQGGMHPSSRGPHNTEE